MEASPKGKDKMSAERHTICRILGSAILLVSFVLFAHATLFAGQLERDYITETQTKPVAVTEELLKDEKKGAPAPSYRLLKDTGEFFVEAPHEKMEETLSHQKKKDEWSLFDEGFGQGTDSQLENQNVEVNDDKNVEVDHNEKSAYF